jgi:hypothetical protein
MFAASNLLGESEFGFNVSLVLLLVLPPFMLLGHIVWEKSLPAFRAFEGVYLQTFLTSALYTTPFFLVLTMLCPTSYQSQLKKQVFALSSKWKGTERRTFRGFD